MSNPLVSGSLLKCSMGVTPAPLTVLPLNRVMAQGSPAGNIMDNKPFVNIAPFGMCRSVVNPLVASATAAAFGVLTPMPCVPMTVAPWISTSRVLIGGAPMITKDSKCLCTWGGQITAAMSPAVTVKVG
ncbi:MAG: DUF4280 domain-containing protein [Gemmatimonadetes bacterium]|nr:DUF4280 domain-containing protein [Gemmatimonadota bacterium]